MGMNLRYSPLDYSHATGEFTFGGANIKNVGNFNANPYGGADYYVDGNTRSEVAVKSGDDSSWDKPYKTLSLAIAASNISIALSKNRWWARRNRIFVCGDGEIVENLTVLPEKCDIIGMGYDLVPYPRIVGVHVIAAATKGVRIFNCCFYTNATSDLMVIPAGSYGFEMHGCHLFPGTTSTKALEITSSGLCRIENNRIMTGGASRSNIFGVGISIEGTTGIHDTIIRHNIIDATAGIDIVEATAPGMGGVIANNIIRAADVCIEDSSGDFMVVDNRLISDADQDSDIKGAIICTEDLACNNIVTHSGAEMSERYPFIKVTA